MRALALTAGLALAACGGGHPQGVGFRGEPSFKQIEECSAKSGFDARAKTEHKAGLRANKAELAAVNACLAANEPAMRDAGGIPQRMETKVTGPTTFTQTYTYGTPPAAAGRAPAGHKVVKGPRGKLPIPSAFPLQAGDELLWDSLTLDQQRRALLFLQDGSTIRASLEG